jgi:hypothetical protein
MKKAVLTIINIVGGACMMLALALPFTNPNVSEGVLLFAFLYYLLGGFTLWYLTAKKLGGMA